MEYSNEIILRCTNCKHEKVISAMIITTASTASISKPVVYELQQKKFEEF